MIPAIVVGAVAEKACVVVNHEDVTHFGWSVRMGWYNSDADTKEYLGHN